MDHEIAYNDFNENQRLEVLGFKNSIWKVVIYKKFSLYQVSLFSSGKMDLENGCNEN